MTARQGGVVVLASLTMPFYVFCGLCAGPVVGLIFWWGHVRETWQA